MSSFPARTTVSILALITAAALALPSPARAQAQAVDPAKTALIRRLLDLTKTATVAVAAMEAQLPTQRAAMPNIPPEFFDEFAARVRREMPRLVELLIPIYDRHFTVAQLQQLRAFYESPIGRHLTTVQPLLAAESIQAGQQWGAQLGAEIASDLAKRGIRMPD